MCWSLDATDPLAARTARKEATAALREHASSEDAVSAAELIIGELLSNAVRHAGGHVCLELSESEGHAQISVHDTSPDFALDIHRPADEFAESGRGLLIVSELARKISVVPVDGMGKRVTVTLDFPIGRSAFEPTCNRSWLHHEKGVCLRPRIAYFHPETASWPEP